MASWLIATTGLIYLATAVDLLTKGNTGLAIAFLGYAGSNIGLIMVARG